MNGRPRLSEEDVKAVMALARLPETNPLGLADAILVDMDLEAALAATSELASSMLEGRTAAAVPMPADATAAWGLNAITAEMLAHIGISPLGASVLANTIRSDFSTVTITDGREIRVHVENTEWSVEALPGMRLTWQSTGTLLMDVLPQTVITTLAGRRLAEILTHPVLDRHDLVIVGARSFGRHQTCVVVEHDDTTLDMPSLAAILPNASGTPS